MVPSRLCHISFTMKGNQLILSVRGQLQVFVCIVRNELSLARELIRPSYIVIDLGFRLDYVAACRGQT